MNSSTRKPASGDLPRPRDLPGLPRGLNTRFNPGAPVVRAADFSATMNRLWQYFHAHHTVLILIVLFVLVDSAITLLIPYTVGAAVDAMISSDGMAHNFAFPQILAALIGFIAADGFLTFLQGWLMTGVSQHIVMTLRQTLFAKLQRLPIAFFDSRPHGEIMSRLSNDIDNVSTTISQSGLQLIAGVISITGSFLMMVWLSPFLAGACIVSVPLAFLLTRTIAAKTSVLFREQQELLGKLNSHMEETISGAEVVKAFHQEERTIADFSAINARYRDISLRAQIWSGFLMPMMNVINNLGFALLALVGGLLAIRGMITIGMIASFISYSRQFTRPLTDLANIFNLLQSGVAGAERVFDMLDEGDEPADPTEAVVLENPKGHVVFDRVHFAYRPDVPILSDISFEAPPGCTTALVGPTGAGKTTIANLLTRFYDVTQGRILLDGRDIREYTRDSLRRCFGIVLQDSYLFSGTIRENIKYGNPAASDSVMIQAAALANADDFIQRLPLGYDTHLSENGSNLSQGQRQLLAIARAILADPVILILDEATSSIDTRTERHIQDALGSLMEGRTSFVIAHRLNTIRDADAIMVIDHGRIAEKGRHDQLMDQGGHYHNMFFSQFKNLGE